MTRFGITADDSFYSALPSIFTIFVATALAGTLYTGHWGVMKVGGVQWSVGSSKDARGGAYNTGHWGVMKVAADGV